MNGHNKVQAPSLGITDPTGTQEFQETQVICSTRKIRMLNGTKGVVVDSGSVFNFTGDSWATEIGQDAATSGRRPKQVRRDRPLKVSGVGEGSQSAVHNIELPCCFKKTDGSFASGTFDAPCVKGSQLPGLLGLNSLEGNRGLIDFTTSKLYFLGPGDRELIVISLRRHLQDI